MMMKFIDILVKDNPVGFMGKQIDQQQLEQTIFLKASAVSSSYLGGDWRYLSGEKNTVFMAPNTNNSFEVISLTGTAISLSSVAFGMLVTLLGMKALQVDKKYRYLNYRFNKLRCIVENHSEAKGVLSCLAE
jgi:hypothetical protein